ncbi:MAG: phosphoribosylformylglycinamidine synthase I [Bacillota bacterium]|nr:MAG: phosphoribosylformylglycinamidine synthase I [Bacillota bacterium]
MRFAIIRFPGSNCDGDVARALGEGLGQEIQFVRHDCRDLSGYAGVVLPGGFAYGDYLRPGALAARTPVMEAVRAFAARGGPVLGICNGFQILCEAGLLPGVLRANTGLRFRCHPVWVRVENRCALTRDCPPGRVLRLEIAHGEGAYYLPPGELEGLEARRQVVLRYVDEGGAATMAANPNGSVANIAGVCNEQGNVVGIMPHPERAVEEWLGSTDGRELLSSWVAAAAAWYGDGGGRQAAWGGRVDHGRGAGRAAGEG